MPTLASGARLATSLERCQVQRALPHCLIAKLTSANNYTISRHFAAAWRPETRRAVQRTQLPHKGRCEVHVVQIALRHSCRPNND